MKKDIEVTEEPAEDKLKESNGSQGENPQEATKNNSSKVMLW